MNPFGFQATAIQVLAFLTTHSSNAGSVYKERTFGTKSRNVLNQNDKIADYEDFSKCIYGPVGPYISLLCA